LGRAQLVLRRQRLDVVDLRLELAPFFLGHEGKAARGRGRRDQNQSQSSHHDTSTRRSLAQPASSLPVASISPRALIFMSCVTPSWLMRPFTACARLSLSARLYSSVPRGSVRPVSVALWLVFLMQSALRSIAVVASVVSDDSLKSK